MLLTISTLLACSEFITFSSLPLVVEKFSLPVRVDNKRKPAKCRTKGNNKKKRGKLHYKETSICCTNTCVWTNVCVCVGIMMMCNCRQVQFSGLSLSLLCKGGTKCAAEIPETAVL